MLFLGLAAVLIAAAAIVWYTGPRVARDTTLTFDPATIGTDLDTWLAEREARVPGIRPGLEKEIVWAFPASKARTPLAIVYVHGFSASKQEIRPLPDQVAEALGANLFYTRLTGHGQDGAAMATATVNAWVNDFAEAIAVGERLGERVVVVATSTGASIASWAATEPGFAERMAGVVLVSPNYGVQAGGAGLLAGPWGLQIARLVAGDERSFEPANESQGRFWTTRYPIEAVMPMSAVVAMAAEAPVERAAVPALFVFSDADAVVRPDLTRAVAARWGAPHALVAVEDSGDTSNHVIAGDALSPGTTDRLAAAVTEWIHALPQ
ncbi:alpha/beta hydrolase [Aquibium microcysteis]|uniref:alpha/beta hydrolase n=1 Tax=Aquibium microcysteis TaxID=675281 RepID=UPI00165CFEB3|nr:alpha/beta fold hydrolase [Aquibium microcysteis]